MQEFGQKTGHFFDKYQTEIGSLAGEISNEMIAYAYANEGAMLENLAAFYGEGWAEELYTESINRMRDVGVESKSLASDKARLARATSQELSMIAESSDGYTSLSDAQKLVISSLSKIGGANSFDEDGFITDK